MAAKKPTNQQNENRDRQMEGLKLPPHSLEAEQSVLGGLMLDNERWDNVAERVVSNDFFSRPHRLIFTEMQRLLEMSKPIDLIRATRPIVIVDEPQSVDGGIDGKGKKALAHMNPLCALRYSATHVD